MLHVMIFMLAADKDEIIGNGNAHGKNRGSKGKERTAAEKRRHDVPIQRPRDNAQ